MIFFYLLSNTCIRFKITFAIQNTVVKSGILCVPIGDMQFGQCIEALVKILYARKAAKVKVCTMLLKPEMYHKPLELDYVAMEIPNDFIVGFGLDYDGLGRNYRDIYVLDTETQA